MDMADAQFFYEIDPASVVENGRQPATFVSLTSGSGFYRLGTGARLVATTDARRLWIDNYADIAGRQIAVRVNDTVRLHDIYGKPSRLGHNRTIIPLPPNQANTTKQIELFWPGSHASSRALSQAATAPGVLPLRIWSDAPLTIVAPTTPTNRLGIDCDSIVVGGIAVCEALLGAGGLMKRGRSVQYGSKWKNAWSSATTYAVGDYVSQGKLIYKALTVSTNSTPVPAGTSDWETFGYNGSVTLWRSWGTKSLADDWSTSGDRTASAAAIAAASPTFTQWANLTGSNDHSVIPPITLANFTTYHAGFLDALHSAIPALDIRCFGMVIRGVSSEVANSNGEFMSAFRSAKSSNVAARSGWTPTPPAYTDLSGVLTFSDLPDNVHPGTTAHLPLARAILAGVA